MREITKLGLISLTSALTANFTYGNSYKTPYEKVEFADIIPDDTKILDALGKEVNESTMRNKYVCVFLSASWCGPCKYIGEFLKTYADANKEHITVILVGLDRTEQKHWNYVRTYDNSFMTLPYKHKPHSQLWKITRTAMGKTYPKGGIPVILMYDTQRNFIEGFYEEKIKTLNYTPWKQ